VKNSHIERLGHIFEHIVAGQKSILDMKWKQRNADVVKGIYQASIYLHTAIIQSGKSIVDRITCGPPEFTPEHALDEQWDQNTRRFLRRTVEIFTQFRYCLFLLFPTMAYY
jgi:hypothetical protein